MKAAVYSPYLDTLGGGEKYMMTIAEVLSADYEVEVLLDKHLQKEDNLKEKLAKKFNLNLSKVRFIPAPVGKGSSFVPRINFLKKYDLLFYLTDGSIFYPTGKKNILHVQSPLIGQPAKNLWGKIKLKGWDVIIYNSKFTQENSQKNWPLGSKVIYPPVDTDKIKPLRKKKYILSVGRIFGYLKDKKYELLIKAFERIQKNSQASGWSLNIVGTASEGDKPYLEELKNLAKNLRVNFYPNLEYDELVKLYGEAAIYWHASGYGENDPTKMEHFGISTVEAMAAGCVAVVIGKGGQKEIVDDGQNGFLWNNLPELEDKSLQLMGNQKLMSRLSLASIKKAGNFSKQFFESNIKKLITSI